MVYAALVCGNADHLVPHHSFHSGDYSCLAGYRTAAAAKSQRGGERCSGMSVLGFEPAILTTSAAPARGYLSEAQLTSRNCLGNLSQTRCVEQGSVAILDSVTANDNRTLDDLHPGGDERYKWAIDNGE